MSGYGGNLGGIGYRWFQVAEVGYDNFMARHAQS
jgi:hypothetical protein